MAAATYLDIRFKGSVRRADAGGFTMAGKPHKTTDQAGATITRDNHSWASKLGQAVTLTWAFRESLPLFYQSSKDSKEGDTFAKMTQVQRDAVRDCLDAFADIAKVTFQQHSGNGKTDGFGNNATLLFANYTSTTDNAGAFAYSPGDKPFSGDRSDRGYDGDVWFNLNDKTPPKIGTYAFYALLHEVGHAMGLDHPGNYAARPGVDPTYKKDAKYAEDTRQYSIMSYFDAGSDGSGANHSFTNSAGKQVDVNAGTLQMHDIAAIQRLYGADTTTRTTNSTYGFNSNVNLEAYYITPAAKQSADDRQVVFCVYDRGGEDTLDFSGYSTKQRIDLRSESFSDVGKLKQNVSIAKGTVIENAIGGSGGDTLTGNDIANELSGNKGDDTLYGLGGDDTLMGGTGVDRYYGGTGEDTAFVDEVGVKVTARLDANGSGLLEIGKEISALSEVENIRTGTGDDVIQGDETDNDIRAGGGKDTVQGSGGKDYLDGGSGASDTVHYGEMKVDVYLRLAAAGKTSIAYVGNGKDSVAEDTVVNFENIEGSQRNDTLIGNADENTLSGGKGDDTLTGGGGKDRLLGGDGVDTVLFTTATADIAATLGEESSVTQITVSRTPHTELSDIENISTGSGDDTLTGNSEANTIDAGEGRDTLMGRGGDDTLDGDAGIDTADYSYIIDPKAYVYSYLDATGAGIAQVQRLSGTTVTRLEKDTLKGIENLTGGAGGDSLYGNAKSNTLVGNGGDDVLLGYGSNDRLDGGGGTDLAGFYEKSEAVYVNLGTVNSKSEAFAFVGAIETDTLVSIENVAGGSGNDTLIGNGAVNLLLGGSGDDKLAGGAGLDTLDGGYGGSDTADYGTEKAGVVIDLSRVDGAIAGAAYTTAKSGSLALDKLVGIENLIGSGAADRLTGSAGNNKLSGGGGNDTLVGGAGDDVLAPGAGTAGDTVDGGLSYNGDTIDFSDLPVASSKAGVELKLAATGNATFFVGGDPYNGVRGSVAGTVRNVEHITGSSAGDKLTGDDRLPDYNGFYGNRIAGGFGDDAIYGGGGNDTLTGGWGKDYIDGGTNANPDPYQPETDTADYSDRGLAISVTLTGAESSPSLFAKVSVGGVVEDTLVRIEAITGGTGNDMIADGETASVNGLANTFQGGWGNDTINGGRGADYIFGNGDALNADKHKGATDKDTLDGGAGVDYVSYEDTFESVYIKLAGAQATRVQVGGEITAGLSGGRLVPAYKGGRAEDAIVNFENAKGGAGSDLIVGDDQRNSLSGGSGNDTLMSGGGAAFDYLDGGLGFDTADYGGETRSLVFRGDSYYEFLGVKGATPDFDDSLAYLSGIEKLVTGSGDDRLESGPASHTFTSGAGADRFIFTAFKNAQGVSLLTTITDFRSGTDKFELDHDVFTAWVGVPADPAVQAANFTQGASSSTTKSGAQIIHNTQTGAVLYDGDGVGGSAAIQFAQLTGASSKVLQASDFMIV